MTPLCHCRHSNQFKNSALHGARKKLEKKLWKWFSKAFTRNMKNTRSLCGYQTSHFSHTFIHSFIRENALNVSFSKCETLFNDKITSIFHTFKKEHEWVRGRHDTSLSIAWHCEYNRLKWAFIASKGISSYAWWNFFEEENILGYFVMWEKAHFIIELEKNWSWIVGS